MKRYFLYILASKRNGTLYVGVTGDLCRRMGEHKNHKAEGFTDKYNVTNLVFYQEFNDIRDALLAEKRVKGWKREWKIKMIEDVNPEWQDLSALEGFILV